MTKVTLYLINFTVPASCLDEFPYLACIEKLQKANILIYTHIYLKNKRK